MATTEHKNATELESERLAFGVLETTGWTPAMVALDHMEKSARIQIWHVELNDFLGTCVKFFGQTDDVQTALDAGMTIAEQLGGTTGQPNDSAAERVCQTWH